MRALITGFGGFAGGHLALHLAASTDWELWGTTFHPAESGPPGVAAHATSADLRRPDDAARVVEAARPDLVFHLAGQAFVPEAWADPWLTFETNVKSQLNLLEAVRRLAPRARVVAITSNEVYGRADGHLPTAEDAPLAPLNPYATSKVAQDMAALQYAASGSLDVVRVRPFTHIGPRQDSRFVAASLARQVAEAELGLREPVVRIGDRSARRDFTDVRDMVRGYRLAAERGRSGAVYNLGRGEAHTIAEMLAQFIGWSHVPLTVQEDPDRMRPSDVALTLCDAGLAERELGWSPQIAFEATLADILEDWRGRTRQPGA